MAKLIINNDRITDVQAFIELCPFDALELSGGEVAVNAGCKMCKLCVRKGPPGAAMLVNDVTAEIDKDGWRGIAVYAEQTEGRIHPVTFELIGKARELAQKTGQQVFVITMGYKLGDAVNELRHYGADRVYVYDDEALHRFRIETYAAVSEDFINAIHPSSILIGATTVGRQLAPRVAARMRTGLTADCTVLDIKPNTDLVQIRPAFGGNIMAEIITPNHRPQMATVRYKVMDAPARQDEPGGEVINREIKALECRMKVLDIVPKPPEKYIDTADVLVVAGRGVKKKEDLSMLQQLADRLGGQLACTRPMIENGWMDGKRQIGLSGRTVRPKLMITCGVSGAIQFIAGMNNTETIVAINKDEKAPIFNTAHYGLVGDLYEIIPTLLQRFADEQEGVGT